MSTLLPLLIASQGIVNGTFQGEPATASLDDFYDRRREVTFTGVVSGKVKGQARGYAQGVSILVKSGKVTRQVELGPSWYVARQESSVNLGDKIKITGTPLKLGAREQVILARQITRGRQILSLRDSQGMPYWSVARRDRLALASSNGSAAQRMVNTGNQYVGTIAGTDTYTIGGVPYSGYVLNTGNGMLNVAMAPNWYWNQQPTMFRIGDQMTLIGNGPAVNVGGVIVANSAWTPNNAIVLRPGGFPVWSGFRPLGY